MHDLRSALRDLGATLIVSLLGAGACMALSSILDSLLLRSLPVREPARLVQVSQGRSEMTTCSTPRSYRQAHGISKLTTSSRMSPSTYWLRHRRADTSSSARNGSGKPPRERSLSKWPE